MSDRPHITRRESLKLAALGAGSALLLPGRAGTAAAQAKPPAPEPGGDRPRNIIFLVADGMSAGVLSLAGPFARVVRGEQAGTAWAELMADPAAAHGRVETHSLNSLVTDSAAAASAWGSGHRVANGAINVLPDGTRLTPLSKPVRASGRRMGLVTTTRVTHATPAGFAAVQASRGDEDQIAPQYLGEVDVVMGGGRRWFDAWSKAHGEDLVGRYRDAGYTTWDKRLQVTGPRVPQRVLGLFEGGHLPYAIDRRRDGELERRVPTLAEMTRKAIEVLEPRGDGFFLMVEGGRVDHAAHGNDAGAIMWEQLAFDDAVREALRFAGQRDDTLVVVTTDHGNSNPGLYGYGDLERLAGQEASYNAIREQIRSGGDAAETVRALTGIGIDSAEAALLIETVDEPNRNELNRQHRHFHGTLGQILGNRTGVQWSGTNHTADHVVLTAAGPGAERFAGLQPNTAAFDHVTDLWGLPAAANAPRHGEEESSRKPEGVKGS
ncbi:MAG: alkaline phosphatase [Phycisphaeraceae bacterium]